MPDKTNRHQIIREQRFADYRYLVPKTLITVNGLGQFYVRNELVENTDMISDGYVEMSKIEAVAKAFIDDPGINSEDILLYDQDSSNLRIDNIYYQWQDDDGISQRRVNLYPYSGNHIDVLTIIHQVLMYDAFDEYDEVIEVWDKAGWSAIKNLERRFVAYTYSNKEKVAQICKEINPETAQPYSDFWLINI